MRLRDALSIRRGDVVAFIGAGGKTSALFRLAHELSDDGWRVLLTTTTHLAPREIKQASLAAQLTPNVSPAMITTWLNEHRHVFLYARVDKRRSKIVGLHPDVIAELMDSVNSDVLLIEADGARRLSLKAPFDHEPVIPADTSVVVPVAGVDVLGQPLDEDHVYNASRIRERYGFPEGSAVLPPWVALTLRDPELGMRGVPASTRVVALLNKVDSHGYQCTQARRIAQLVLRSPRINAVALGAMQSAVDPVHELQRRVTAVVLAAGMSTRMRKPKLLLPWDGGTVIESIVSRLTLSAVDEIIVVTGHYRDKIAKALADQPVRLVHNPHYARGEVLSSLQAGLRALPDTKSACLVVLGDQPAIDTRIVGQVLSAYAQGDGEIVTPTYRGRRGHPVLIDRRFWPELLSLPRGAPRDVLKHYPEQTVLVPVDTDSILRDIDTPEQYQQELLRAGLGNS
ncbi:MAG: putative selenium-dependent hydroxylase accessory protein YqeC [Anaerolineae bacterium]|nr:putative selenium-dependent hydroxylase accessory protein YqeC [Anaerolineae bacterium]